MKKVSLIMILILISSVISGSPENAKEKFTRKLIQRVEQIRNIHSLLKGEKKRECLSIILHEARRNQDKLTDEGKEFFKAMWGRPEGFDEIYTTGSGYFTIHYTVSGEDAVSEVDSNENNVPDYIETMSGIMDEVFEKNIGEGFILPPPDNEEGGDDSFDIYVSNSEVGEGIYGYTAAEDFAGANGDGDNPNSPNITEVDSWYSYMALRNNYEGFGETEEDQLNSLRVTCAHEFAHAVQFGYGTYIYPENGEEIESMDGFMMEGCATWSEDWIYPGIDDNFQYLGDFFNSPDFALNWNNEEDEGIYEDYADRWYSTWIFFRYLSEMNSPGSVYSGIIKNLYERTVTLVSLDAIETELMTNYQKSLNNTLDDFYITCALLTNNESISPYTFLRADDYRAALGNFELTGVAIDDTITFDGENAVTHDSQTENDGMLMRLGCDYIKLITAGNCRIHLEPNETLAADLYSLVVLKADDLTHPTFYDIVSDLDAAFGKYLEVGDVEGFNEFLILIINHATEPPLNNLQYSISVGPPVIVDGTEEMSIPSEVKLYQNYPNPFNPSTVIRYGIPDIGTGHNILVQLRVYDVLGNEVATLVNEEQSVGYYEKTWNAENMTSGVYFAVLRMNNNADIKKLILIK